MRAVSTQSVSVSPNIKACLNGQLSCKQEVSVSSAGCQTDSLSHRQVSAWCVRAALNLIRMECTKSDNMYKKSSIVASELRTRRDL